VLAPQLVVFTDLDGTLLDHHTYSFAPAEAALYELARRHIPLIFVSSKTRAEIEVLRRQTANTHPFISENGGGIFIPHDYFKVRIEGAARVGRYQCLSLARPYREIVSELAELAEASGASVAGFQQMSVREIVQNTGLPARQAELARQREFDEPFFFAGASEAQEQRFVALAKQRGLEVARGGRFWHLFAGSDKGRAVRQLIELYRRSWRRRFRTVALGDSANDLPMLAAVDVPILLPHAGSKFDKQVMARLPRVTRAAAPGPAGWNQAVLEILGS
jgi:mannosyl-3-phosphoglycerate phosphatase